MQGVDHRRMWGTLAAGWQWWRQALRSCIPSALSDLWHTDPVSIHIVVSGVPILQARDGRSLGAATPDALRRMAGSWRRGVSSVVIDVPAAWCLVRDVDLPDAPSRHIERMLALDLEATTPFRPSEIYSGWYRTRTAAAQSAARYVQVILKRSAIRDLVEAVEKSGLTLRSVRVVSLPDGAAPLEMLAVADRQIAPATRWMTRLAAGAVGVATIAALATVAVHVYDLERTARDIDGRLQSAAREAQTVRRTLSDAEVTAGQMRMIRQRKLETVPTVALWEELTRVLPMTTWLTDLRVDGGQGQIDGFSQNAPDLIRELSKSPMLSEVAFASPVTRDPQHGAERFQIKFSVRPATALGVTANGLKGAP